MKSGSCTIFKAKRNKNTAQNLANLPDSYHPSQPTSYSSSIYTKTTHDMPFLSMNKIEIRVHSEIIRREEARSTQKIFDKKNNQKIFYLIIWFFHDML
jgi:hypothetical protein